MTDGSAWFDPVHGNEWEGPAELTIGHLGADGTFAELPSAGFAEPVIGPGGEVWSNRHYEQGHGTRVRQVRAVPAPRRGNDRTPRPGRRAPAEGDGPRRRLRIHRPRRRRRRNASGARSAAAPSERSTRSAQAARSASRSRPAAGASPTSWRAKPSPTRRASSPTSFL